MGVGAVAGLIEMAADPVRLMRTFSSPSVISSLGDARFLDQIDQLFQFAQIHDLFFRS
jgi:hypothetical protein